MKKLLAFLCLIFFASMARAGTYTTLSCSYADVNAAINNTTPGTGGSPQHQAVNGDVIIIGAGSCTWATTLVINGVGIDITGTGTPNTGGGTFGAGASNTTLINAIPGGYGVAPAGAAFFQFTNLAVGQTAKIELLTLSGAGAASNAMSSTMEFTGICNSSTCPNVRVDNITWAAMTFTTTIANGLIKVDNVFGVADHNTSTEMGGNTGEQPCLVDINFSTWQGTGQWGDNSFASPDTLGTAQAFFIENNALSGTRGEDSDSGTENSFSNVGGERGVCRFNQWTNISSTGICSSHGTAWTGRPRGTRQIEVYYNSAVGSSGVSYTDISGIESGVGYFLSNTFSGTGSGGGINYFLGMDIARFIMSAIPWNSCDGTQPWDAVPWSSTSVCLDQPGRGQGVLYTGPSNTTVYLASAPTVACTTAGQCFSNNAADPVYEAGEQLLAGGGSPGSQPIVVGSASASRLLANRDYYVEVSQTAQTSPTAPFNGSTGTGYGTLANRPPCSSGCIVGAGYWATDQGTWNTYNSQKGVLYTWSGSAWTVNYTPYTYPHPLTGGGGSTVATPTFSPTAGGYTGPQTVTITTVTSGAAICYTTNGIAPTAPTAGTCGAGSTTLTNGGTITVSSSETVEALGTLSGSTNSAIATAVYFIGVAPATTMFGGN